MKKAVQRPCAQAVRLLLLGPAAPFPSGVSHLSQLPRAEQAELGALWAAGLTGMAARWKEHRVWLLKEAARLTLPKLWSRGDRPCFFGEFICSAAPSAARKGKHT
jgi:hypothetical protein